MMHNAALTQMTAAFRTNNANSTVYDYDTATFFSNLLANASTVSAFYHGSLLTSV